MSDRTVRNGGADLRHQISNLDELRALAGQIAQGLDQGLAGLGPLVPRAACELDLEIKKATEPPISTVFDIFTGLESLLTRFVDDSGTAVKVHDRVDATNAGTAAHWGRRS
ncbi:hypothetical protein [Kineosporia babensis]|uniref:Uncharacterized protein n=1 Tax=Kineosporia babensis TaxID=499548 RepID=A0A9X1NAM2_9ACTN|nr:hypothetical protein [Kineosporia babensis]MCD5310364.1 hypothetical protein [Kineosporia babensis]